MAINGGIKMEIKKQYFFPMNYKHKEKFLGFIDYKNLVFIAVLSILVFIIIKNLYIEILWKIVLFITTVGIPAVFVLVGVNGENMLDFIWSILKYLYRGRVYVYKKEEDEHSKGYKKLFSYKKY